MLNQVPPLHLPLGLAPAALSSGHSKLCRNLWNVLIEKAKPEKAKHHLLLAMWSQIGSHKNPCHPTPWTAFCLLPVPWVRRLNWEKVSCHVSMATAPSAAPAMPSTIHLLPPGFPFWDPPSCPSFEGVGIKLCHLFPLHGRDLLVLWPCGRMSPCALVTANSPHPRCPKLLFWKHVAKR